MFEFPMQFPGRRGLARRSGSAAAGGFTLIEILCVVVILGIASAIIIPQIGSRSDLVVSSAARVVMADLIYAQNRAIATQAPHYVNYSIAGQQYTLSNTTALTAITNPVTNNPYTVSFGSKNSPMENVSLTAVSFGGPPVLGFDELGSPFAFDPSNNTSTPLVSAGTIQLTCGNSTLTVSVEPYTGETTVSGN